MGGRNRHGGPRLSPALFVSWRLNREKRIRAKGCLEIEAGPQDWGQPIAVLHGTWKRSQWHMRGWASKGRAGGRGEERRREERSRENERALSGDIRGEYVLPILALSFPLKDGQKGVKRQGRTETRLLQTMTISTAAVCTTCTEYSTHLFTSGKEGGSFMSMIQEFKFQSNTLCERISARFMMTRIRTRRPTLRAEETGQGLLLPLRGMVMDIHLGSNPLDPLLMGAAL